MQHTELDKERSSSMPFIKTATIKCYIGDEDKEAEGALDVHLFHEGTLVYERDNWGVHETWSDETMHQTTSGNLEHRRIPAHGTYVLNVVVSSGDNINMRGDWSIEILTTDGQILVSDPYQYMMETDVREMETSWTL